MAIRTEKLIEGVLRGDSRALREFLLRLRPQCMRVLWERFARLGDAEAELLDEAESLLFEWSVGPDARERLLRGEPLSKLAFRLVWQVARDRLRADQRQERLIAGASAEAEGSSEPPPVASYGLAALQAVILALPATHRDTLVAEARFQQGKGPPPAEALAIEPVAARVRLHRARAVLLRALSERGLGELIDSEVADE